MGLLSKIGNFLTGNLGGKIIDGVKEYFPPSMSDKEKADLELAIKRATDEHEIKLLTIAAEQDAEFNERIKEMEGTAKDLKQFGWLGRLIIFLRGCQRPVWGFITIYMDIMWFSGKWPEMTQQQESALWMVNVLVLGFLFGERAIKNGMPVITKFMEAKKGQKGE